MNEIDPALVESPDIRYIITSNGAVVFDKNSEKPIYTRYVSSDSVSLMFEATRPYNVFIVAHEGAKTCFDKNKYNREFLNKCGIDEYFGYIISQHAEAIEDFESYLLSSDEVEMVAFLIS